MNLGSIEKASDIARQPGADGTANAPPTQTSSVGQPFAALARRGASDPNELSPFVGRLAELQWLAARITADLSPARLITIVGAPGVGKTRLARRYVLRSAPNAPFVDLTNCGADHDVAGELARAAGVEVLANDSRAAWRELGRQLTETSHTLLVLDNAEHVVEGLREGLAVLLEGASALKILVTSRERLAIAGEEVLDLEPLKCTSRDGSLPEAVELFILRATAAQHDLKLTGENHQRVADLVARVDGLPLAIELLASRLRLLGLSELDDRVSAQLATANGMSGEETAGLRAAIRASWEVLSDAEQRCLAELTVFRGGFTFSDAEQVLSDRQGAGELIASLRDHSLLFRRPTPHGTRLGLFETVRAFAAVELEAMGIAPAARARHRSHFLQKMQHHSGSIGSSERARRSDAFFRDEMPNLAAAADYFIDDPEGQVDSLVSLIEGLHRQVCSRGPLPPHLHRLERARPVVEASGNGQAIAQIIACQVHYRHATHGVVAVRDELHRALGLVVEPATRAQLLRLLAYNLNVFGDFEPAKRHLIEAMELLRNLDDHSATATALVQLASVERDLHDYDEALEHLREARAIAAATDNAAPQAHALINEGKTYLDLGDLPAARAALEGALELADRLDLRPVRLFALNYLGQLDLREARLKEAMDHLTAALKSSRSFGNRVGTAQVMAGLGFALLELGDNARARHYFEECTTLMDEVAPPFGRVLRTFLVVLDEEEGLIDAESAITRIRHLDGNTGLARMQIARVRARNTADPVNVINEVADVEPINDIEHCALRLLERAVGCRDTPGAGELELLTIDLASHRFRLPSGEWQELREASPAWRILSAIAREHADCRRPLRPEELVEAGWPGERMRVSSAKSRLQMTISRLRNRGLEAIRMRDGGYVLDADDGVLVLTR